MKIQSNYKSIAVVIFLFFILPGGLNQQTHAQTVDSVKKRGINAKLSEEIKAAIKAKESRWSFDKEVEYVNILNNSNTTGMSWKLNKKQLGISITEFQTVKDAVKFFAFTTNPNSIAVYVPLKPDKDFADEAVLRVTNLNGGSMIDYVFRQGNYTVSIWSEEKDARRFAEYVLAAIKNQ